MQDSGTRCVVEFDRGLFRRERERESPGKTKKLIIFCVENTARYKSHGVPWLMWGGSILILDIFSKITALRGVQQHQATAGDVKYIKINMSAGQEPRNQDPHIHPVGGCDIASLSQCCYCSHEGLQVYQRIKQIYLKYAYYA